VPGAYAAALEAGGCGLEELVGVWAAAEDGEKDEGAAEVCEKGAVRDVTWAAGHKAVFERVKRCAGAGAWAGLEMLPWRVADAVRLARLARLARVSEASEACEASDVSEASEACEASDSEAGALSARLTQA
jgi:hypothetical protein